MMQTMSFLGLVVKDIEAATKFYRDTLGFEVDEGQSVPQAYTQFKLNGGAILGLLTGFEQEGIEQAFDAAIVVEDADSAYARMREKGVEVVGEPHDMPFGRTFLFRTPEGHTLRAYAPPSAN